MQDNNQKKIKTWIVDAFTSEKFKGNPAGVCIARFDMEESLMLSIAKELGFSETAYIKQIDDDHFFIRFFSPKVEIPLCGHATIASSKVIFDLIPQLTRIHFHTIANLELKINKTGDKISMEFPLYDTEAAIAPVALLQALGIEAPINGEYNKELRVLIIQVKDSETLCNLKPDFQALVNSHTQINGVCVTALSAKEDFDFESRYFWPWSGTNEDPASGGIHTFLTTYWNKRLNKTKMNSFQCSERTGSMQVEIMGHDKLLITSEAQIILEGAINI